MIHLCSLDRTELDFVANAFLNFPTVLVNNSSEMRLKNKYTARPNYVWAVFKDLFFIVLLPNG